MRVSAAIATPPTIAPSTSAVLERGLLDLRVGERQGAVAHTPVQVVLDRVDLRGARVGLGPQVARVGRVAAELEADQMVLLVVRRRPRLAVEAHLAPLERVRVLRGR